MAQAISFPLLTSINLGVQTSFNKQFGTAGSVYKEFSYVAPSNSKGEVYPRLDLLPGLREWIGDRVVYALSQKTFEIDNRTFEQALSVKREDIEDDKYGILTMAAEQLGQNAGNLPDLLVSQLLSAAHTTPCYDGQNFCDTAHPDWTSSNSGVVTATTSANYFTAPSGESNGLAWYLVDTTQVLRPVIFQNRRPFVVVPKFSLTDEKVFWDNEYVWGVDGRCNAGFGIWQTLSMSTAPLNAANFITARSAMTSRHRPDGTPLNIKPNLCIVPSALVGAAKMLFEGDYADVSVSGGVIMSNPWKGACRVLEDTWLN